MSDNVDAIRETLERLSLEERKFSVTFSREWRRDQPDDEHTTLITTCALTTFCSIRGVQVRELGKSTVLRHEDINAMGEDRLEEQEMLDLLREAIRKWRGR